MERKPERGIPYCSSGREDSYASGRLDRNDLGGNRILSADTAFMGRAMCLGNQSFDMGNLAVRKLVSFNSLHRARRVVIDPSAVHQHHGDRYDDPPRPAES